MYIKKLKRRHDVTLLFSISLQRALLLEHHFLHLSSLKLNVHHKLEKDVYIADFELSLRSAAYASTAFIFAPLPKLNVRCVCNAALFTILVVILRNRPGYHSPASRKFAIATSCQCSTMLICNPHVDNMPRNKNTPRMAKKPSRVFCVILFLVNGEFSKSIMFISAKVDGLVSKYAYDNATNASFVGFSTSTVPWSRTSAAMPL